MLSIAYSDFRAGFREVRTSEGFLSIADLGRRPAKPNKANLPKAFVINNMTEKSAQQTKLAYHTCYQLLTAILTAIFRKSGWKGLISLSGIRAHGPWVEDWGFENQDLRGASGRRRARETHAVGDAGKERASKGGARSSASGVA